MLDAAIVVAVLGLLIWLAYRGISVLVLAPVLALLAAGLSGQPVLATLTQIFMQAAGNFIVLLFPLFLLGAVFGKMMEASGSATSIARATTGWLGRERAILSIVLACAILTYGGVSLFVVAFAVFPVAAALFREAGVSRRLIPATIGLGAFTFTMTALPGTPAIQNLIPMPFFGTTPFAAPGIGLIAGAVMLGVGQAWLSWRERSLRRAGEGYEAPAAALPEGGSTLRREIRERAQGEGFDTLELSPLDRSEAHGMAQSDLPGFGIAALPIVLVVALNLVMLNLVLPALDTAYLAEPPFGPTTLSSVQGMWAIIAALSLSILATWALNRRRLAAPGKTLSEGANASVLPIFNTAALVGFGAVIAGLPAFEVIRDAMLGMAPGNPLISLAISVSVLAGITGSASGGMGIALQTMGETYLASGAAAGISPELLHRVTTIATGGLDALPHNGAVISLLTICGLTHREAYGDIFVVAVLGPILSLVVAIALGTMLGSF
ncbi:GntP family permease [Salinarimonas rosea]|uniref:GntP family permease n=1 Tax=Salinarimonas rosea TaxID=552063 RepID=UPI00041DA71C|nr:GntP family permease [Salinarimonas rosea]